MIYTNRQETIIENKKVKSDKNQQKKMRVQSERLLYKTDKVAVIG